eukprot:1983685-Ditylum_brightwellii.AAC.1
MTGDYVNDEKEVYDDASKKFESPRSLSSYKNHDYPKQMNQPLCSRTQAERRHLSGGKKGSGGEKKGERKDPQ